MSSIIDIMSTLGSSGALMLLYTMYANRKERRLKRKEIAQKEAEAPLIKDSLLLGNAQKAIDIFQDHIKLLEATRDDLVEEVREVKAEAQRSLEEAKSRIDMLRSQLADSNNLIDDLTSRLEAAEKELVRIKVQKGLD